MQSAHAKAVSALLAGSPDIDAQDLVSTCLVRSIHELSLLNVLLLAQKQKKITDKKRGEIFSHLTTVNNLLMILYHATSTEVPDEELIVEMATEFPLDYMNDGILCNMHSIASLTSVAAMIFDTDVGQDPDAPTEEEAIELVEEHLGDVYVGLVIACSLYELDFGEVVEDAAKLEEWT